MSTPHNIVLFIDGSWNKPSRAQPTNVYKLFRSSVADAGGSRPQLTYYLPGVGHDIRQHRIGAAVGGHGGPWSAALPLRRELPRGLGAARGLLGGVFGAGTAARIKEAYAFLCHHFIRARGDRIYVFGFSRGAFAARSLAGFVFRVGTLLADKLHLVEAAYAVYESGHNPDDTVLAGFLQQAADVAMLQQADDPAAMPLHFVGLWDTVAALGLPRRAAIFTADRTEHHQRTPPLNVLTARHALALHELRADFRPELWHGHGHTNLQQLWFAGAHGDVGGGYALAESGLSNLPLQWMADEARASGLRLEEPLLAGYLSAGEEQLHNSLNGLFRGFTPTPRQALLAMHGSTAGGAPGFHPSVGHYLQAHGGQLPRHWPESLRVPMAQVDQTTLQLYLLDRLRSPATDMAAPDAWWQQIGFDEVADAAKLLSAFREQLSLDATPAERVAQALLLRRLLADDRSLEELTTQSETASRGLDTALRSGRDPRDEPGAAEHHRVLQALQPVLDECARLLKATRHDAAGPAAGEAAERARKLMFDYSLAHIHHGIRGSVWPPRATFKSRRPP